LYFKELRIQMQTQLQWRDSQNLGSCPMSMPNITQWTI